jgi:hypothetical protein
MAPSSRYGGRRRCSSGRVPLQPGIRPGNPSMLCDVRTWRPCVSMTWGTRRHDVRHELERRRSVSGRLQSAHHEQTRVAPAREHPKFRQLAPAGVRTEGPGCCSERARGRDYRARSAGSSPRHTRSAQCSRVSIQPARTVTARYPTVALLESLPDLHANQGMGRTQVPVSARCSEHTDDPRTAAWSKVYALEPATPRAWPCSRR